MSSANERNSGISLPFSSGISQCVRIENCLILKLRRSKIKIARSTATTLCTFPSPRNAIGFGSKRSLAHSHFVLLYYLRILHSDMQLSNYLNKNNMFLINIMTIKFCNYKNVETKWSQPVPWMLKRK